MRIFPLIVALVVCGCSRSSTEAAAATTAETPPQAAAQAAPTAPKPVPAEIPNVLAHVNGEDVTKADLDRAVGATTPASEMITEIYVQRNQLSALSGGVSASFQYDGLGRRRAKTMSGSSTGFLYDGLNTVQELVSGSPSANIRQRRQ